MIAVLTIGKKTFARAAVLFTVLGLFCTLMAPTALADTGDAVFTVEDVRIDITAESAVAAREQALDQAQQLAFRKLAERLLSEAQLASFQPPPTPAIGSMIKDFEITDERLSSVRYIGTYTFRFKSDTVRNFLGSGGYSYSDLGSKPVLVLPFYQWGSRTLLWDEFNPWLLAWNRLESAQGLVPITVPIGDAEDIADIGEHEALTYDQYNLERLIARYRAGEAVILVAVPGWTGHHGGANGALPDNLQIMIYQPGPERVRYVETVNIFSKNRMQRENIFDAAARLTRTALQKDWKERTLVDAGQNNALKVRVGFSSMQEWIETQKTLKGVRGIDKIKMLSLSPNEANLELHFTGNEQRLRLALAQSDMTLTMPRVDFSRPPVTNSRGEELFNQGYYYDRQPYDPYGQPESPYRQPSDYRQPSSPGFGEPLEAQQAQAASPLVYELYLNKYGPEIR